MRPVRRARRSVLAAAGSLLILAGLLPAVAAPVATAVSPNVVISQVYGGGGNTGAPYTHDFVELFNRGNSAVSLAGNSIQYASATGTGNFGASSTQLTELPAVTLQPGQYFLVQQAGGATGAALPAPDHVDPTPIAMAAAAGKVAYVTGTSSLGCNGSSGQPCSAEALARIVDLVGYGNANFFEGTAAAPAFSNTTAGFRGTGGCTDTDNNSADFSAASPGPRNSASTLNPCPVTPSLSVNDVSLQEGNSGTTSFDFTVSLSAPAGAGGVTFDIATADGTASAPADYAASSLTGQTIPAGSSSYQFTVAVNADTAGEADETFTVNVTNVTGATVGDGQGVGTIVNDDVCGLPFTPIPSIQGSGASAAVTGNVTTEGVVVGDFEGSVGLQGFYLQDPSGDENTSTSDGIFVFTGSANTVSAGQHVRVTGFARERFNQTALNGSNSNTAAVPAANIVVCGTGSVAPTDVEMPFTTTTEPERFEGMLVRLTQELVISEYFNYERFGEVVLALPLEGESRHFTPTSIVEPGAPANARAQEYLVRRITLDDGLGIQNPSTVRHPNGAPFSLTNRFRGGDTVENTVGVMGFDFNLYRIHPTGAAQHTAVNSRPEAPEEVGGAVRAAAMNTLNFFITPDYATGDPLDNKCGPARNVECRGHDADQPNEFGRQRAKLVEAIAGLDADIVGLNELENTTGVDPLGDPTHGLVAGLNAKLGDGTYAAIETGTIGTDAIKVGLIYRPGKVTPIDGYEILDSTDDPRFLDTKSRPVLAQTFEEIATGARFTVAVNHLKSKGSDCNDVGDPDAGDGQGNCNQTRLSAAQALVDWLATDPTGSGDADFLILGDLNSYAKEDPIDAILAGPDDTSGTSDDYVNLIERFQGTYAYSYVFDGQAGYLDHAIASPTLAAQITGAADWHINADEPDLLDYDTSFKPPAQDAIYEGNAYRSSDHDPVVVGVDPVNAAPVADDQDVTTAEDTAVAITLTASDPDSAALSYSVVTGPSDGTLSGTAPNLTYTPDPDFNGTDTFTFKPNDGYSDSNVATVTITVTPVNDAPDAVADSAATTRGTAVLIDVLANDSDVDGDELGIASWTKPAGGSVRLVDGVLRYGPKESFRGTDTFTYTVEDENGAAATTTVTVTVSR